MPTVAEVVSCVEQLYPPTLAESWDHVGLVVGRPDAQVRRIMVTVDVTPGVVAEALETGVDFILAHHPLLFSGVTSVAATDVKGLMLHDLIEAGCALMSAHTNADSARTGVSDALAAVLGVLDTRSLEAAPTEPLDLLHVFVPSADAEGLLAAVAAAGAGAIGDYDRCAFMAPGTGTFRPLSGADPYIGSVGRIEQVAEVRLETVLPRGRRAAVLAAMHAAHPYEEPAFGIVELAAVPSDLGIGRVGALAREISLGEFVDLVGQVLPQTAQGVRATGDPMSRVRSVAVCGGSGDSLLEAANASAADVYVTADLKHHRVSDHVEAGGCAVVDVAHWASEFPWCDLVAGALRTRFGVGEDTVSAEDAVAVEVCRLVTDPWTQHLCGVDTSTAR